MSLEKLISEIASSHPVATRAQRVTGITHRVGEARQTAVRAEESATQANADVLEAAESARQAGEDARQAGADVLETIRQIEAGELKSYIDLTAYANAGKLAGQITGVYIADLAVSRAKIADAAINSAKIANLAVNSQHVNELTASKITSGDISASLINLTGRLEAGGGGVRLDGWGLGLTPLEDTGGAPADRPGRKITNVGNDKWTALFPFAGGGVRGMGIRSDGVPGGANGRVEFVATNAGSSSANSTGRLRIDANPAVVRIENALDVPGAVTAGGRIGPDITGTYARQHYVPPFFVTSGSNPATITHPYGVTPDFLHVQANYGNWRTLAGNGNEWNISANSTQINIRNDSGATRDVRMSIMNGS